MTLLMTLLLQQVLSGGQDFAACRDLSANETAGIRLPIHQSFVSQVRLAAKVFSGRNDLQFDLSDVPTFDSPGR